MAVKTQVIFWVVMPCTATLHGVTSWKTSTWIKQIGAFHALCILTMGTRTNICPLLAYVSVHAQIHRSTTLFGDY